MKSYAQNAEDIFIADHFGDYKGTLLSIGENDGLTFSNARLLIEKGWEAYLVEPSSAFKDLEKLYENNPDVVCYPIAITDSIGTSTLYESGAHIPGGRDHALVSSLDIEETKRWFNAGVMFTPKEVSTFPFNAFWELTDFANFDFISIDAEGYDLMILKQIDLKAVGCTCLIIEHNGNPKLKAEFEVYCKQFDLVPVLSNSENIIFIKP